MLFAVAMLAAFASLPLAADKRPDKPPGSLTEFRCYDCHRDREAVAGPAFADIAAGFRGKPDALSRLATDIRSGIRNGGPWHMPPHPEVSPSEARTMARYILSLDRKDTQEAGRH